MLSCMHVFYLLTLFFNNFQNRIFSNDMCNHQAGVVRSYMTSYTYSSSTRVNEDHVCSYSTFWIYFDTRFVHKQLCCPPQKSKMAIAPKQGMRGKFKIRFTKWKLPFCPCYHTFLWCLMVKDSDKTCYGCSPQVSHEQNYLLSADRLNGSTCEIYWKAIR